MLEQLSPGTATTERRAPTTEACAPIAGAPHGSEDAMDHNYRAASSLHNYREPVGSNGDPAQPKIKLKKKKKKESSLETLKDEFKQTSCYSPTQFLGWLSIAQRIK